MCQRKNIFAPTIGPTTSQAVPYATRQIGFLVVRGGLSRHVSDFTKCIDDRAYSNHDTYDQRHIYIEAQ